MRVLLSALIVSLGLSACRSAPTASFDTQAADYINKQGTSTIEAHAFYRDEKGKVIYAAGEHAYLIPVTQYAEQRFAQVYGKSKYIQTKYMPWDESDPQFKKYMRSTKAEANGRFSFDHVAQGDYYVATSVSWMPENSIIAKGAAIYERVTITGKESDPVKVIVSGK
jgi:hypothetical protein